MEESAENPESVLLVRQILLVAVADDGHSQVEVIRYVKRNSLHAQLQQNQLQTTQLTELGKTLDDVSLPPPPSRLLLAATSRQIEFMLASNLAMHHTACA